MAEKLNERDAKLVLSRVATVLLLLLDGRELRIIELRLGEGRDVAQGHLLDLVEAGNVRVRHDYLREGGIVTDLERHAAQDGEDVVWIGAGVDAKTERGDGEVAREIGDGRDLAVGNDIEGAIAVAQGGTAQTHVDNGSGESAGRKGIIDGPSCGRSRRLGNGRQAGG